jgi:hypothetical protein
MLKRYLTLFFSIALLFSLYNVCSAIKNPNITANNKYGIHITDESDILDAATLVNSTGGDWGYVTFVIRSDERDTHRWQQFFDKLRKAHLIPIVRIASKQGPGYWEKLNIDEIDGWATFLSSLNWVIQNRYVIVGNEVNLGSEWGGKADPNEYADYYFSFSQKLKDKSGDFFVMPSSLESTAKTNKTDIDEKDFIDQMINHKNNVFNNIDGLASHSYPYNEIGSNDNRGTLKHFEWELNLLKNVGISKNIPVFITETGWMHGKGNLSESEISAAIDKTNLTVWNDDRIIAITPFLLNYKNHPFDVFSWISANGTRYSFFNVYQNIKKVQGIPTQIQSGDVLSYIFPRFYRTRFNNFYGFMFIKNTGQTIWKGYQPTNLIINNKRTIIKPITILSDVEPGQKTLAVYTIK